jgi:hypothetical protein
MRTLGMMSLCIASLEGEPRRLNGDARSGPTQIESGKTGLTLSV